MACPGLTRVIVGMRSCRSDGSLCCPVPGAFHLYDEYRAVSLQTPITGRPIAFEPDGDVKGGTTFTVFQIQKDGSYRARPIRLVDGLYGDRELLRDHCG